MKLRNYNLFGKKITQKHTFKENLYGVFRKHRLRFECDHKILHYTLVLFCFVFVRYFLKNKNKNYLLIFITQNENRKNSNEKTTEN